MSEKTLSYIVFIASIIWCGNSFAENALMKLSNRTDDFEITLTSTYVDSQSISGEQGSSVDIQDSWGWGFGFGYNLSEHLAFNFDIGWRSANYDATIYVEDKDDSTNSGLKSFTGRLDTASSLFSATYNFMDKRFTPYVTGLLGWTFVDTNVPTGPPQNWCWYDAFYGYICSSTVPTRSETDLSYGGALGVRFDVGQSVFLRLAYTKLWIDFKNTDTRDFDAMRLDIGFLMN